MLNPYFSGRHSIANARMNLGANQGKLIIRPAFRNGEIMIRLLFIFLFLVPSSSAMDSYKITLPNGLNIDAEVAKDKERGLQGREGLCSACGMIFIYDKEGYHRFWMKDTLINLAMLWIDKDGKVVHIVKNTEPCVGKENPYAECEIYAPLSPAKYVLEVNP